jgi:hypothetical protein
MRVCGIGMPPCLACSSDFDSRSTVREVLVALGVPCVHVGAQPGAQRQPLLRRQLQVLVAGDVVDVLRRRDRALGIERVLDAVRAA